MKPRGYALFGSNLLLLSVLLVSQLGLAALLTGHWQLSDSRLRSVQASQAAYSGLAHCLARLSSESEQSLIAMPLCEGELAGTGSFTVRLQRLGGSSTDHGIWQLHSEGVALDGRGRAVQSLRAGRRAGGELYLVDGSWHDGW